MTWQPAAARYASMTYNRCGRSGLKLPAISLGLWHNFGNDTPHQTKTAICRRAFDLGITHFDLANNYGPPPGSAETAFGEILRTDFAGYRDQLIISSKAGYDMWPGPYGEWGSRKYVVASCDQSLKRLGLDYVDIFYSHRFDPETPLEETMMALDHIVRSGRALYVGISSYNAQRTREAAAILKELGTPCLIHQPSYSMINRWVEEDGLLDTLDDLGIGSIVFSPLAQGMLTAKYLKGIPEGSRASLDKSLKPGFPQRAEHREYPRPQRDCREAWTDARADGDRLGAAGRAGDLGADRRQPPRAGRGLRQGARQSRIHRCRTRRNRHVRARRRHQSLGGLGRTQGTAAQAQGLTDQAMRRCFEVSAIRSQAGSARHSRKDAAMSRRSSK
jgi:L-glyceraldehyde 3-phosphate reductase